MHRRIALSGFALGMLTMLGVVLAVESMGEARAVRSARFDRDGFEEALDTVLDRYVDPVDESALLAEGLRHVVAGLDPHSHYLTAAERKALRRRARGGRTGLSVVMKTSTHKDERWLEVVAVAPKSPADEAGLQPGDHVLAIRGQEVSDMLSQAEAEAQLLGAKGETIHIRVQRRTEPAPRAIELKLTADRTRVVQGELVETKAGKVAHVVIRAFAAGTGDRVKRELRKLRRAAKSTKLSGIVLDLRGNPGGEVDQALVVADLFVASGVLTRTRGRGGRILREEQAHAAGTDTDTPLVVLQDRHCASAAELLAAALHENGRATLVGERSYGKGTVQEVKGLSDGSVLTLTIARYYSPRDRVIDGKGIAPDIHVASGGLAGDRQSPAFEKAIDLLAGG